MNHIDTAVLEGLNLRRAGEQRQERDKLGQDEFLKLMTAQLNNQDPLKPMQSGEFFTQIAQFSSVAGMQELQDSFKQVASAMFSSQVLQASAMIGRSVLVPGQRVTLEGGKEVTGMVELGASTPSLQVSVYDAAGQLVRRLDLGQQSAGEVTFQWDGRNDKGEALPAGEYVLRAEAQYDGGFEGLQTYVAARVESVAVGAGGQGVTLNLAGRESVGLAGIKRVM